MHRPEAIKGKKYPPTPNGVLTMQCVMPGGEFGAVMQVHIQNDGPITLQFETPNLPKPKEVRGRSAKSAVTVRLYNNNYRESHLTLPRQPRQPRQAAAAAMGIV